MQAPEGPDIRGHRSLKRGEGRTRSAELQPRSPPTPSFQALKAEAPKPQSNSSNTLDTGIGGELKLTVRI